MNTVGMVVINGELYGRFYELSVSGHISIDLIWMEEDHLRLHQNLKVWNDDFHIISDHRLVTIDVQMKQCRSEIGQISSSVAPTKAELDALLSDQIPICDRAPRKANEAPDFFAKDDTVTEPESLLFHDDLTLSTGRIPWLTGVLRKLSERVPAVCRLEVAVHGEAQSGTGFRFHEDWILTNWHVLFLDGKTPAAVTAEFGYEQDENENGLTPTVIACDAASIVSGKGDDWGVIRAKSAIPAAFAPIELSQSAPAFVQNPAFIIQHPNGARKRVAYTRNQITFADDRVVQYISDTQSGSSGAPVFDEKGRIIAVHHAGGRPQEVAGRAPMKKNEGIRIGRIEAALKQSGFGF